MDVHNAVRWMACILLVLMILPNWILCAIKDDYYNLYDDLFDASNYKKELRPALTHTSKLFVYMEFHILSLIDVDEKQQTLVTSARLQMSWTDDILSWNTASYGNIITLLVPQENIYLPDIVVANSVVAQESLGYKELQVRINFSGHIDWQPTVILSTSCDVDITYFPFDTQKCFIDFETAVSINTEIDVKIGLGNVAIFLDDYSPNGVWDVLSTTAEDVTTSGSKTRISFGLLLKRRRTFYILYIILPIFFLSLVSSLVFALPIDEGEKIGMGITNLLTFAVYLSIVSDMIPNTSLQISILGLYLTILLGLSAFSVVVCVLIVRFHFRDKDRPVGTTMTQMSDLLRTLTCMKKNDVITINQVVPEQSETVKDTGDEKMPKDKSRLKPPIQMFLKPEEQLTWQDVAYILDKFCFIVFSLSTILITVACMLALIVGGDMNAPSL